MHAQRRVVRHRIAYGPPAIHTPMHRGLGQRLHAERSTGGHRAHLVVETPDDVTGRGRFFSEVPLNGLRRPVEDLTVSKRPAQLQVLGVRPHEWHRGAGRLPEEQLPLRNVGAVPDLLGKKTTVAREGLERLRQLFGGARTSSRQLVVGALASEERPGAADADAVERWAVGVYAVAVTLIAMPRRTVGRVDLELRVDDLDRAQNAGIVGCAQSEADERERVEADHRGRRPRRLIRRTIFDWHEAVTRPCGPGPIHFRDAP